MQKYEGRNSGRVMDPTPIHSCLSQNIHCTFNGWEVTTLFLVIQCYVLGVVLNLLWGKRLLSVEDLTVILRWRRAIKALFLCFNLSCAYSDMCHGFIHHFPSFLLLEKYQNFLQSLTSSVCESQLPSLPPRWYIKQSCFRQRLWVVTLVFTFWIGFTKRFTTLQYINYLFMHRSLTSFKARYKLKLLNLFHKFDMKWDLV